MGAGDPIPRFDHLIRYCSGSHVQNGKVSGTGFRLKPPKDGKPAEDGLSLNWVEVLHPTDRQVQLERLRAELAAHGMTVRPSGAFAVMRCGKTVEDVSVKAPDHRILSAVQDPLGPGSSHALLTGYTFEEKLIADLIAETVIEVH